MKRLLLGAALALTALPAYAQRPSELAAGPLPVYAETWCYARPAAERKPCLAKEQAYRDFAGERWARATTRVRYRCMLTAAPDGPFHTSRPYWAPYQQLEECLAGVEMQAGFDSMPPQTRVFGNQTRYLSPPVN